jgi:GT2 family glycosyltransferase
MQTRTMEILQAESVPRALACLVVIPCLNEAETIAECVSLSRGVLDEAGYDGEVIVVDNGSTDGSGELARAAGALVVDEPRRGYGSAYLAGLAVRARATTSSWSTPT